MELQILDFAILSIENPNEMIKLPLDYPNQEDF